MPLLEVILDLVSRSKKPVQALAWASIGNVLTTIQICEAYDRGGFIFAREVGLHENVHELDFSSLYPNSICTRNVSPEGIRCDCHSDREDVQRDCLERLDAPQSPDAGLGSLERSIENLRAGDSVVERLVERTRFSKPLEGHTQNTQNVAALKRARDQDLAVHPEQDIEYAAVDHEESSRDRVALAHEAIDTYDASYYETRLVRAVETVLSPLG